MEQKNLTAITEGNNNKKKNEIPVPKEVEERITKAENRNNQNQNRRPRQNGNGKQRYSEKSTVKAYGVEWSTNNNTKQNNQKKPTLMRAEASQKPTPVKTEQKKLYQIAFDFNEEDNIVVIDDGRRALDVDVSLIEPTDDDHALSLIVKTLVNQGRDEEASVIIHSIVGLWLYGIVYNCYPSAIGTVKQIRKALGKVTEVDPELYHFVSDPIAGNEMILIYVYDEESVETLQDVIWNSALSDEPAPISILAAMKEMMESVGWSIDNKMVAGHATALFISKYYRNAMDLFADKVQHDPNSDFEASDCPAYDTLNWHYAINDWMRHVSNTFIDYADEIDISKYVNVNELKKNLNIEEAFVMPDMSDEEDEDDDNELTEELEARYEEFEQEVDNMIPPNLREAVNKVQVDQSKAVENTNKILKEEPKQEDDGGITFDTNAIAQAMQTPNRDLKNDPKIKEIEETIGESLFGDDDEDVVDTNDLPQPSMVVNVEHNN